MSNKQQKIDAEMMRHSLSHVLALAVQELYPKVKFGIGPAIDNGFYYDFDFGKTKISDDDLPKIEKKMKQLIKQNLEFKKKNMAKPKAFKLFKDQKYKLELIKTKATGKTASVYELQREGGPPVTFVDVCKGPHITSTKDLDIKAFKLDKLAGAYWLGDEKNTMLTRIYGLAFETKEELNTFIKQREEAEKRDHRKLGARLDLFTFHDEGPGSPFWHNNGLILKEELINYWRTEHRKAGYSEVSTPIMLKEDLWYTSKHMQTYKDNMYFSVIDKERYAIKPMNCPGDLLLYKERPHSYKELPMRVGELGLVHRHELSGTLHGLFRVRAFTQDDAHIFCTQEQVKDELKNVLNLTLKFYKIFGFKDFHMELSTRPEKYTGDLKMWDLAEKILEDTLKEMKLPYQINPGDGAFYGPKIDSHLQDSIGRTWQCGTVQLDFAQPENFKLEYIDEKGGKQRPVMLHRTIYGSIERFMGILIEHYAGALPLWLSPIQAQIIPVGANHKKYAEKIAEELKANNIRAEARLDDETVGKKIREGEVQKIPYLIVVGDKEIKANNIAVRSHNKDLGVMTLNKFVNKAKMEIEKKTN